MSGFRETAWLREAHDRAECPSECSICARIESVCDQEPRGAKDYHLTQDFEEYR